VRARPVASPSHADFKRVSRLLTVPVFMHVRVCVCVGGGPPIRAPAAVVAVVLPTLSAAEEAVWVRGLWVTSLPGTSQAAAAAASASAPSRERRNSASQAAEDVGSVPVPSAPPAAAAAAAPAGPALPASIIEPSKFVQISMVRIPCLSRASTHTQHTRMGSSVHIHRLSLHIHSVL
jgi:hypothetical protein